jgi:hypothetical protein
MQLTRELQGHAGCVNTIKFNDAGSLLISGASSPGEQQRGAPITGSPTTCPASPTTALPAPLPARTLTHRRPRPSRQR